LQSTDREDKWLKNIKGNWRDSSCPCGSNFHFNGNIDEFRISDTVRYASDFVPSVPFVQDEYTVALYHFDLWQRGVATKG